MAVRDDLIGAAGEAGYIAVGGQRPGAGIIDRYRYIAGFRGDHIAAAVADFAGNAAGEGGAVRQGERELRIIAYEHAAGEGLLIGDQLGMIVAAVPAPPDEPPSPSVAGAVKLPVTVSEWFFIKTVTRSP